MQNGGNKKCNDKWEHFLPKDFKRPDEGDPDLETFIRNKYQFGKVCVAFGCLVLCLATVVLFHIACPKIVL